MNEPTVQATASNPKRRRLRFGMRGLLGIVLFLGLVFGWIARMQRQAVEREAVVAELARDHIRVNSREPNLLCLVLSKLLREPTILPDTPARLSKWLSPGGFSRPVGFNAGRRLRDEEVPRVVERLQRLGDVHEVQFRGDSLNGLRLFYIDKVPYGRLGAERDTCTFKVYPVSGATSGSLRSEHP
jgi:hypothetical protein